MVHYGMLIFIENLPVVSVKMFIVICDKNSGPHTWCHCLKTLKHSAIVQEWMSLKIDWWLKLPCPAYSTTCYLTFHNLLCALHSCVVEATTVCTRPSLSYFKRAQFPFKTCTRTDYPLLVLFFENPIGFTCFFV